MRGSGQARVQVDVVEVVMKQHTSALQRPATSPLSLHPLLAILDQTLPGDVRSSTSHDMCELLLWNWKCRFRWRLG